MPERKHVRLFRNGRNQAVRIPVEFESRPLRIVTVIDS
jgi:virulence-associated protein VagC